MSITQEITSLPAAPERSDPDNFASKADAFLAGMEDMPAELNAFATQANTLASDVNDNAASASTSANTAAAAANQTIYSASTTYAAGAIVQDPSDDYKAYTSQQGSNTGHTPNSDDGTWWELYSKGADISYDSSPQLGGDLDGQGHKQYNTLLKLNALGSVSANQSLDCSAYNQFSLEPTAAITLNFTNVVAGTIVSLRLTGGGDHTLTWQVGGATTNWKWAGGAEPDWSETTGVDIVVFIGNGTNSLDAGVSLQGVE